MQISPKPFFDGKVQQVWGVEFTVIQDRDDDSPNEANVDNEFRLSMHLCPGGGWYFRIKGEIALDMDEIPGLEAQLDQIAQILNWH